MRALSSPVSFKSVWAGSPSAALVAVVEKQCVPALTRFAVVIPRISNSNQAAPVSSPVMIQRLFQQRWWLSRGRRRFSRPEKGTLKAGSNL